MSEELLTGQWWVDEVQSAESSKDIRIALVHRIEAVSVCTEVISEKIERRTEAADAVSYRADQMLEVISSETDFDPESQAEAQRLVENNNLPEDTMNS